MFNFTRKCQLFINVVPFYSYFAKGFILNLEGMFKFIKHLQYTTKMTGVYSPPLGEKNMSMWQIILVDFLMFEPILHP